MCLECIQKKRAMFQRENEELPQDYFDYLENNNNDYLA